jgi:CBS domain-containing protein
LSSDPGLGGDVCVGETMGTYAIAVSADVEAETLFEAFSGACAVVLAAIVVDENDRPVGLVHRSEARRPHPGSLAGDLAREVRPVRESMTLASAIARMVREHRRALPVVNDSGQVVGLVSDLDALEWAARARANQ